MSSFGVQSSCYSLLAWWYYFQLHCLSSKFEICNCYPSKFNFTIVDHDVIAIPWVLIFRLIIRTLGTLWRHGLGFNQVKLTLIPLLPYSISGPYHWHPPTVSNHSNEQCHTPSRERWRIWVWVSGWQGLCQFFLLFWRLPNRSLETREDTYPYCQDGLLRTDLLPHCFLLVQFGLLGLLPLPVKRCGCYWCGSYSLNLTKRRCPS